MIELLIALLLAWLAGAFANWAADVLPERGEEHRHREEQAAGGDEASSQAHGWPGWHYLTLPWYFFRGGQCPHCGAKRPWRAPALEAAMMVCFAAGWLQFGGQPLILATTWFYTAFLLLVLVIDFEHRLVLNVMTVPGAVAALALSFLPGMPGPLAALAGGLAGLALFLLFALISRGHMGAGDVKLAGLIGLMLGFPAALYALFAGVFLGGIAAIVLLITRRAGRKSTMAYAPYLSLGALAVLLQLLGR